MSRSPRSRIACVLGDMDLIRALGLAGIVCVPVAPPGAATTYSRYTVGRVDKVHETEQAELQVELLLQFARTRRVRPVLYYEADAQMLIVSRHRDRLREAFDFVIPDAELIETLVDKIRFSQVAERRGLPVPRSRSL